MTFDKIKIDPKRCKQEKASGWQHYQCSNKPKKDGYCMVHHPESVQKRRDKEDKKYEEKDALRKQNDIFQAKGLLERNGYIVTKEEEEEECEAGKWLMIVDAPRRENEKAPQ